MRITVKLIQRTTVQAWAGLRLSQVIMDHLITVADLFTAVLVVAVTRVEFLLAILVEGTLDVRMETVLQLRELTRPLQSRITETTPLK